MLEPVGPLNPRVYWIRRAAVVAVVVVVALVLFLIMTGRDSNADTGSTANPSSSATTLTGELASSPSATSPSGNLTDSMFPDASSVASAASASSAATGTDLPAESTAATVSESASVVAPAPADPAAESAAAAAQAAADAAAAQAAAQAAADAAAAQAAADAAAAQAAAQAAADAAAAQAAADAAAARPRDAEGRLICPDSSITLAATVGSPTYNVGQQPIIGVTVTNSGSEACVRDVSGSLQEYLAYDVAGTRVWSTSDCLPGTGTDVRFMQPGESLNYNIKWSGRTSQPGCAGERTTVPAGVYNIEVRMGSLVSSLKSVTFQ